MVVSRVGWFRGVGLVGRDGEGWLVGWGGYWYKWEWVGVGWVVGHGWIGIAPSKMCSQRDNT